MLERLYQIQHRRRRAVPSCCRRLISQRDPPHSLLRTAPRCSPVKGPRVLQSPSLHLWGSHLLPPPYHAGKEADGSPPSRLLGDEVHQHHHHLPRPGSHPLDPRHEFSEPREQRIRQPREPMWPEHVGANARERVEPPPRSTQLVGTGGWQHRPSYLQLLPFPPWGPSHTRESLPHVVPFAPIRIGMGLRRARPLALHRQDRLTLLHHPLGERV
jgi:hypothetical protein